MLLKPGMQHPRTAWTGCQRPARLLLTCLPCHQCMSMWPRVICLTWPLFRTDLPADMLNKRAATVAESLLCLNSWQAGPCQWRPVEGGSACKEAAARYKLANTLHARPKMTRGF